MTYGITLAEYNNLPATHRKTSGGEHMILRTENNKSQWVRAYIIKPRPPRSVIMEEKDYFALPTNRRKTVRGENFALALAPKEEWVKVQLKQGVSPMSVEKVLEILKVNMA